MICNPAARRMLHIQGEVTDVPVEKILSAIVELKCPIGQVPEVLDTIAGVAQRLETIVAVGVATRCDAEGEDRHLAPLLAEKGYVFHRGKTNLGLGRASQPVAAADAPAAEARM